MRKILSLFTIPLAVFGLAVFLAVPAKVQAQTTPGTITITSPTAGDTWQKGSTYQISWNSTGLTNSLVNVYLADKNSYNPAVSLLRYRATVNGVPQCVKGSDSTPVPCVTMPSGSTAVTIPSDMRAGNYNLYVVCSAIYNDCNLPTASSSFKPVSVVNTPNTPQLWFQQMPVLQNNITTPQTQAPMARFTLSASGSNANVMVYRFTVKTGLGSGGQGSQYSTISDDLSKLSNCALYQDNVKIASGPNGQGIPDFSQNFLVSNGITIKSGAATTLDLRCDIQAITNTSSTDTRYIYNWSLDPNQTEVWSAGAYAGILSGTVDTVPSLTVIPTGNTSAALAVSASPASVSSGDTVTLKFSVPSNTVLTRLYLACPAGITATAQGNPSFPVPNNMCNQFVTTNVSTMLMSVKFMNSGTSAQTVVPNFYAAYPANPNFLYGVTTGVRVLPSTATTTPTGQVSVSNASLTLGAPVMQNNQIVAYPISIGFTVTAGNNTIYLYNGLKRNGHIGFLDFATTLAPNDLVPLVTSSTASPASVAGDGPSYYVVPAGTSRTIMASGVASINDANNPGGINIIQVTGVDYDTNPSRFPSSAFVVSDGLSNLITSVFFTATSTGTTTPSTQPRLSNTSLTLGAPIVQNNQVQAYPLSISFTVSAGNSTLYLNNGLKHNGRIGFLDFETTVSPNDFLPLVTNSTALPATVSGDGSTYYAVPSGTSRTITATGVASVNDAPNPTGDNIIRVGTVNYDTDVSHVTAPRMVLGDDRDNMKTIVRFGAAAATSATLSYSSVNAPLPVTISNQTVGAYVNFAFTVTAGTAPIYIATNPAYAVSFVSNAAEASLLQILPTNSLTGDSAAAYQVPAGASRTFVVTGAMNNAKGTGAVNAYMNITGIYYSGSAAITSRPVNMVSGSLNGLRSTPILLSYLPTSNGNSVSLNAFPLSLAADTSSSFYVPAGSMRTFSFTVQNGNALSYVNSSQSFASIPNVVRLSAVPASLAGDTSSAFFVQAGASRSFTFAVVAGNNGVTVNRTQVLNAPATTDSTSTAAPTTASASASVKTNAVMNGTFVYPTMTPTPSAYVTPSPTPSASSAPRCSSGYVWNGSYCTFIYSTPTATPTYTAVPTSTYYPSMSSGGSSGSTPTPTYSSSPTSSPSPTQSSSPSSSPSPTQTAAPSQTPASNPAAMSNQQSVTAAIWAAVADYFARMGR